MNRRQVLKLFGQATASFAVAPHISAKELHGFPHETALSEDHLPNPAQTGRFRVLTKQVDRDTLSAVYDRLIPADEYGPSATEAGCLEFIDDQLAGDYGSGKALYLEGPMDRENEIKLLGKPQFLATPKERYLTGLTALEAYSQQHYNVAFAALSPDQVDEFLLALEADTIDLGKDIDGAALFELMLQNAREGYLADPIYGGNKDMAGWKMIGFPGARYDYRPYLARRGEVLNLIPVSLIPND